MSEEIIKQEHACDTCRNQIRVQRRRMVDGRVVQHTEGCLIMPSMLVRGESELDKIVICTQYSIRRHSTADIKYLVELAIERRISSTSYKNIAVELEDLRKEIKKL